MASPEAPIGKVENKETQAIDYVAVDSNEEAERKEKEKLLSQTPEEAREMIKEILSDKFENYDDEAGGEMVKGFKKQLELILTKIPELNSLGFDIAVESRGTGFFDGTTVYLKLDNHFIELASQFYEKYSMLDAEGGVPSECNHMLRSVDEKVRMAKSFSEIYKEKKALNQK